MGREVVATKGLPLLGRLLGGAGRTVPRVARVAAPAAGLVGAGWLVSRSLSGTNGQSTGGDSGGSATSMGGGGLSGGRAGLASSRGFTAPNNDNSPRKVSYNPNGNFETESLRLQASSANSLASIDNTVRNMLKFSVAKATWDTRSLREMSIEASNNSAGGFAGGAGGNGMFNAANGNQQGGISPLLVLGLTAAAGALLAGITTFGKFFGGGNGESPASGGVSPAGSQGSLGAPAGSILQQIGVAGTSAAYANDASNRIRATPARPVGAVGPIAANDNTIRRPSLSMAASQGRLGSALTSGAGRGVMKVFRFLKGLRATPVGRFPILTTVFALIDPLEATIMSGGTINDSVKRELIGAIAMIIAGPAGVAMGAAVGAATAIPATPVGMAVGAILGGLGGAIAALSAEFVAEQIYDLIAGNITLGEFARKLGRGAMNGLRNSAALAGGAILGGALAGVGMVRRAAGANAPAIAETGGAAARVGMRMPARVAVGAAVIGGGAATYHMTRPNSGPAIAGPALMQMQGTELHAAARLKAEQYLGRSMTNDEWDVLLRTVYAESGRGEAGREDAMILATILNRARSAGSYSRGVIAQGYLRQGLTVLAVLFAENQFQAVTGTVGNRRPSAHWTRGPNHNEVEGIFRAIMQFLDRVPHNQVAFTAASAAAYGAGTNISYRDTMLRNGGQTVGRTVFNTALLDQARPQNMAPAAAPVIAPPAAAGGRGPRPQSGGNVRVGGTVGAAAGGGGPRTASGIPLATITTSRLGLTAQVNAAYAPKFQSFINELEATGYVIRSIGGYANRRTARGGFSHHANGDSIDINPAQNPHVFGRAGITDMPIEQTRAAARRNGLGWGFDWSSSKDAMHFSVGRNEGGSGGANDNGHAGHAGHGAGAAAGAAAGAGAAMAPRRTPTITWANLRPAGGSSAPSPAPSPAPQMAPATPQNRLATNIVAASVAAERKNINVVVQNAQTQESGKTTSRTQKTDTSAAESVSSPVMAAYEYAAYWGVD